MAVAGGHSEGVGSTGQNAGAEKPIVLIVGENNFPPGCEPLSVVELNGVLYYNSPKYSCNRLGFTRVKSPVGINFLPFGNVSVLPP